MGPTIKEIADLAGVSASTVSRALNNKSGMENGTRKRIVEIANRLGYRPSAFARGLVTQQAKTIMVLIPDVANYFFAELTQQIGTVCRERGFKVLLANTNNLPSLENEYLDTLWERTVDGAIIVSQLSEQVQDRYLELMRANFPIVLLDRVFDRLRMSSVLVDNVAGGEMVVDYLCAKGHSRIAFVGGDPSQVQAIQDRHQGYLNALEKNGLEYVEAYDLLGRPSPDMGGIAALEDLLALSKPPTAIFADNDLTAIGCVGQALKRGFKVPDDIALVGFDNLNISPLYGVPLTTVSQRKREIAANAVDSLLNAIRCRQAGESIGLNEIVIQPELIVRDSA